MVTRRFWQSNVLDKELAALNRIDNLIPYERTEPIDLENLIRHLHLQVRKASLPKERTGSLTRHETQWTIHLPARSEKTFADTRFTIAHEVAHVLLSEAGLGTPVSEEEYWILESACDRIATCLLVPQPTQFSTHLLPEDVPSEFEELRDKWLLPSSIAARFMCDLSNNLLSVMSVRYLGGTHFEKLWELVKHGGVTSHDWDSYIDNTPFANMCDDLFHSNRGLACDYLNGAIVVGVRNRTRVDNKQLQLDLQLSDKSSSFSPSDDIAIFFHLSEPTCVGQEQLSF